MSLQIRYLGHFGQNTGYGIAATHMANALERAGCAVERWALGSASGTATRLAAGAPPDVTIVHTLPRDCPRAAILSGPEPKVAYTTWEAVTVPAAILDNLAAGFAMVWVPSVANRRAFEGAGVLPAARWVRVVPHTYDELAPRRPTTIPPEGGRYRFYWVGAWSARKNPAGLIRAYAHAFRPADPVDLFLHAPGTSMTQFLEAMASTGLEQNEMPLVTFDDQWLSDDAMAKLIDGSDCFVTASRGEAWNLPAFEASLHGRHVIAPSGQGSDDFLLHTTAALYDCLAMAPAHQDCRAELVTLEDGRRAMKMTGTIATGLSSRDLWREPDLVALASRMRHAFEARRRHLTYMFVPADRFGYAAVAKTALSHLEEVLR